MLGVLLVTHGGLASEFLATARTITGMPLAQMRALSLPWTVDAERAAESLTAAVAELRAAGYAEVLVLTGLGGDTPSRAAAAASRLDDDTEVVTGMNLPMVVRLACLRDEAPPLHELGRWIQAKGRRAIRRGAPPPSGVPQGSACDAVAGERR